MFTPIKFYFLIFFFALLVLPVYAQQGTIKGLVMADSVPVPAISVSISGSTIGTITDDQGYYLLEKTPIGNYTIIFSGIGYDQYRIPIKVEPNGTTVVNAFLQKKQSNLDEVVVTGISRGEALRKSPVPITVVNKSVIEQNINNNAIDVLSKTVPGVSSVSTGPNVSKPFIRGLGYNRVLTLYDGMRQEGQQWGDEHGIEIDPYGISRVEVIKGPASLTYGSDALAGVINFLPATPDFSKKPFAGDFTLDYHSNNRLIGSSLGLGYQHGDWTYLFRGSAKTAQSYTNKVDGPVYGTAFREYDLSGSVQVDRSWGNTKLGATLYDNLQEIPDGSRDSLTRKFTKQLLDDGDDIKNRPIVPDDKLRSYRINPLHQHVQYYRIYSVNTFRLGDDQVNLTFGGQRSVRREYNHPTQPEQAGLDVSLNTLTYEVKYAVHPIYGIESTFGVNGMYQTNRSGNATDFPIPDYNLFDIGAYFFAKRSIGKIDLSGGLRYDSRHLTWEDFYVGLNPSTDFDRHIKKPTDPDTELQFPAFSHRYQGISGSFGAAYNLTDRLVLKGNIARGYRSPNITEIGSNGLDPGAHIVYLGNRSFVPEFNLQEDFGILYYTKALDLGLELFNNDIQHYIYQSRLTDTNGNPIVIVPGNTTYQYQQSKARLYGMEWSVNLHPSQLPWLTWNNSMAYVVGLNKDQSLLNQYGKDAKYLPLIPPLHIRSTVKISAQKALGIFDSPYFKVEVDHNSAQNHFYAVDGAETATSDYTLINCGLGATIKKKDSKSTWLRVFLEAENLFNIAYQSHLNRLKYFEYYEQSPSGRYGIYNMGRNFSFKVILPL
ncbi:TonB-dependent receptor [Olivibacter ginsenosidimutans]|uniref:TonB-dependent receptor n=1 Tax=Olivibacter ginsenosidimutans TaxID=1176537 RepID=A0ABP9BUC3_9SPHI